MSYPIHVAKILLGRQQAYLFLRAVNPCHFQWFSITPTLDEEKSTECAASSPHEAIKAAARFWKPLHFLHCGFRYSLPERDEVGCNALFEEMVKSYSLPNGRYMDPQAGHLFYVDFASQEALALWRMLRDRTPR